MNKVVEMLKCPEYSGVVSAILLHFLAGFNFWQQAQQNSKNMSSLASPYRTNLFQTWQGCPIAWTDVLFSFFQM